MTERSVVYLTALLLIGVALAQMFAMHERHYKNRRYQMLEGRVDVLERIVRGEHD